MAFGKRTTVVTRPATVIATKPPIVRRWGGYPLGVLTVGAASYAGVVVMTLSPYFNPTGRSVIEMLPVATGPVLNAMAIAAVVLLAIDVLARVFGFTGFLIYGLLTGGLMFVLCLGLLQLTGARFDVATVVLVLPTAVGGGVLGLFRRRA